MQLSHHATVIPVSNMQRSLEYYTKILKFDCTFKYEEPPTYAVLKRDEVSVHLTWTDKKFNPYPQMYIFCYNVEEVYREMVNNQAIIDEPLAETDYGMKEFSLLDPDGHCLNFGQGIQN